MNYSLSSLTTLPLLLVAGCMPRQFNNDAARSSSNTATEESPGKGFSGCYNASRNGGTQHPMFGGKYVFADKICITARDGEQKAPWDIVFYNGETESKREVIALSPSQPRCPGCYTFENLSAKIGFNGEQPDAIQLTYTDLHESTAASYDVFKWKLVKLENLPTPHPQPTAVPTATLPQR
jgi:hypothetical protein